MTKSKEYETLSQIEKCNEILRDIFNDPEKFVLFCDCDNRFNCGIPNETIEAAEKIIAGKEETPGELHYLREQVDCMTLLFNTCLLEEAAAEYMSAARWAENYVKTRKFENLKLPETSQNEEPF